MIEARIRPEKLRAIHDVIYGEHRVSGPIVAGAMGQKNVTLWSFLSRTGMPVAAAEKLANVLTTRAAKLQNAAAELRRLSTAAQHEG